MSDDTCKREVAKSRFQQHRDGSKPGYVFKDVRIKYKEACNKPKPADKLYCPDCEKEIYDEPTQREG
jgi:hypothetical protein